MRGGLSLTPRPPDPREAQDPGWDAACRQMVATQLAARDIDDERVLEAMAKTPRHAFVPQRLRHEAYEDRPLHIGHGQTISQPYIVALMTQEIRPTAHCRVLDVGTGSGYQAAVLGRLTRRVHGVEIVPDLAAAARERMANLGASNVTVTTGDGYGGLPEFAPYDAIVVAAAPDHVPPMLVDQLAPGGRLVIPVGRGSQDLVLVTKGPDGATRQRFVTAVRFVPMTGEATSFGLHSDR